MIEGKTCDNNFKNVIQKMTVEVRNTFKALVI